MTKFEGGFASHQQLAEGSDSSATVVVCCGRRMYVVTMAWAGNHSVVVLIPTDSRAVLPENMPSRRCFKHYYRRRLSHSAKPTFNPNPKHFDRLDVENRTRGRPLLGGFFQRQISVLH